MAEVEIGRGKSGRRAFGLHDVGLAPTRRTRDAADVDLSWQVDAYQFDLPILGAAMDSVMSPTTAGVLGEAGGLGVVDLEGIWSRHADPAPLLAELADLDDADEVRSRLRDLYDAPFDPDLLVQRVADMQAAGVTVAGAVSPRRVAELASVLVNAELDLLVILGSVISAEHVSSRTEPLNLKSFVRELETPVLVGGCSSYQHALHLMRTGAAGVLVGVDGGATATAGSVIGVASPMATAVADVRAARMRHLDESGVYVHVIANGGIRSGGDIAKAVACGADAVMVGASFAAASDAPGGSWHWARTSVHAELPQGDVVRLPDTGADLATVISGPAVDGSGATNLAGALRQAMATTGYSTVKELQKADLVVLGGDR